MMVGYSLSILITLTSCVTQRKLTQNERKNIQITDSIVKAEKQSLILDYREEENQDY